MNDLSNLILKNLINEDKRCEIEKDENPMQFLFKRQDYLIHISNIHSWTQRPHMRRVQISKSIKERLIKYQRYYVFGIFGYDSNTDTFTNWSSNYLQGSYNKKSLYTYKEFLEKALSDGVSQHLNQEDNSLSSIHFQSKYLGKYLQNFKPKILNLNNENITFLTFDHYHSNIGFQKLLKIVNRHHTLSYISDGSPKISDKWDREEYILTLDLYFTLQKKDRTKSAFKKNDPIVLEVYEFLKLRSKFNKTTIRNLSALSYRHGNYQYADPEYSGKGLTGAGKKSQFKEFFDLYVNKQSLLKNEVKKIRRKYTAYFSQEDLINIREYKDQDPNLKRSISTIGLDEEDINNKQEKANRLHIETLNILANYIRKLGLSPFEDPQTFDLFAFNSSEAYLFEVKSITKKNFRTQFRHALVQLEEYAFRHKKMGTQGFELKLTKTIVFDQKPSIIIDKKMLDFYINFTESRKINIIYVENGLIRKY